MLFSLKTKGSVKDSVRKMGRLLLSKNIARAWTHGILACQFRKGLLKEQCIGIFEKEYLKNH